MIFEMYNETWKGADDMWGLFDKDRKIKSPLQQILQEKTRIAKIEKTGDDLRMELDTFSGNTYALVTNSDLISHNWSPSTNLLSRPATNRTSLTFPIPAASRLFYRLHLQL